VSKPYLAYSRRIKSVLKNNALGSTISTRKNKKEYVTHVQNEK
jgi:CRISPR/Cas system CMR-associated protein Cmr5 small subunit